MNSKQFRILIQMLEAIRGTMLGVTASFVHDHSSSSLIEAANGMAIEALEDAEALEASEYFQEEHRNEHRRTDP